MFLQTLTSRGPECSDVLAQVPFSTPPGWIWLGAGDTQGRPLGSEASDDEAKQTEEKVTPTDGGDTAQTLVGSLDFSLLWASHLSEPNLSGSSGSTAIPWSLIHSTNKY